MIRNEQIGNASFEQTVDRTDICEMGKVVESARRKKFITNESQGRIIDIHTTVDITKQTYPTDKDYFKDICMYCQQLLKNSLFHLDLAVYRDLIP